jgi:hypothetical protein
MGLLGKCELFAHHFHRTENAVMTQSWGLKRDSCGQGQCLPGMLGSGGVAGGEMMLT